MMFPLGFFVMLGSQGKDPSIESCSVVWFSTTSLLVGFLRFQFKVAKFKSCDSHQQTKVIFRPWSKKKRSQLRNIVVSYVLIPQIKHMRSSVDIVVFKWWEMLELDWYRLILAQNEVLHHLHKMICSHLFLLYPFVLLTKFNGKNEKESQQRRLLETYIAGLSIQFGRNVLSFASMCFNRSTHV